MCSAELSSSMHIFRTNGSTSAYAPASGRDRILFAGEEVCVLHANGPSWGAKADLKRLMLGRVPRATFSE